MRRVREKSKGNEYNLIILVILLLCVGVGYSVFTTDLRLDGNSSINTAKWDIHFEDLVVDKNSTKDDGNFAKIEGNTINFHSSLMLPGDYYSFSLYVVNAGNINASIDSIVSNGVPDKLKGVFTYKTTYSDGSDINVGDVLKKGEMKQINFKMMIPSDTSISDLPSVKTDLNLTYVINYVQYS